LPGSGLARRFTGTVMRAIPKVSRFSMVRGGGGFFVCFSYADAKTLSNRQPKC
jgi:hypothetical protein